MEINLIDFIYPFDYYTNFEILDRDDGERIFSGTRAEVLKWLETTDNVFTVRLGTSKGYFSCMNSTVMVYPDYRITY